MDMHRNLLKLFFYCVTGILLTTGVSAQQNMVRKWIAQKPIVKESDIISATATVQDVLQMSEYVDGFGRPIQSVAAKASPLQKDAVSMHVYDAQGREAKIFMPFVSNIAVAGDVINDGNYKTNAALQQTAFNQGFYTGETSFYLQVDFENSPLNRVTKTYAPGSSWVGASRGSGISTLLNTAIDNVRIWNILDPQSSLPTSTAAYIAGQLYKSRVSDDRGLQVIEFKDKDGHVILKKVQLTAAGDAGTGSVHTGWLCTYYVYDDYGNMRFIITPRVVELIDGGWTITQSIADELCYRNEYDDFGRVIIAKSPGSGEQWSVYDKLGRLVMSQDANMRQASQKQWKYYQYENSLDRLKTTGLLTDPANYNNRAFHQAAALTATQITTSLSAYPALGSYTIEQLTQTYYDEYQSWVTGTGLSATADLSKATNIAFFYAASDAVFPYPQVVSTQSVMTRGMMTGSKTEVLKSSGASYLYTISYYDDKGRIIQTQGTNYSGTGVVDKATTQYSWSGTPLRILEEHSKTGINPQTHTVLTKMEYDFAGRLQKTTKKISGNINNGATIINPVEKRMATFTYNELGRVKTKAIGTLPGTDPLTGTAIETLTYDYNVRGWLTGINKAFTQSANNTGYFGMELGYDKTTPTNTTTSFTPVYNGNITGMIWKSKGDAVPRKYDYTYDNVNQLTKAAFLQSGNGSTWDKTSIDYSVNSIQYDLNGNIKKLNQNGFVLGGASNIDDLTYNYGIAGNANSNKLMNVLDVAPGNAQSKLGDYHYAVAKTGASVDYGYDPNGNLISDANKGISLPPITYNVLNLPWVITTPKGTITYTYDAAGNKLKKVTQENNVSITLNGVTTNNNTITTITTYIGGFIYQSKNFTPNIDINTKYGYAETLQYMLLEEGRARIVTPQSGISNFAFDYFIRDHLGNVRATVTDEEQKDYYPAATVETAGKIKEAQYYNFIDDANHIILASSLPWYATATNSSYLNNNSSVPSAADPTTNRNNSSSFLYKLRGITGTAADRHGLNMTLKVTAGDLVNIYGKSVWHSNSTLANDAPHALNTVLTDLINVFAGTGAVMGGGKGTATGTVLNGNTSFTNPLLNYVNNVPTPAAAPKAYINYIFFDEQFKLVAINSIQYSQVSSTPDNVISHTLNVTVPKNGYIFIYCSNESNQDIYFDNLQVTHQRSQLIQEQHYYPGGLSMAGISSKAYGKLANAYGYQGKEMQAGEYYDGTGLEEYDFEARYYDVQLMRWHNQDPEINGASPYIGMANNPVSRIDPDGKNPLVIAAILGAAFGAYSGYKVGEAKGADGWNMVGYILGGAAIGGLSGYAGASVAAGGGFMANTAGIMFGSVYNSVGMSTLSGGVISPSVSFGVASFDFGTGEFGYLGKKGNSFLANLGYTFGAMANISDLIAGVNGTNVKLISEKKDVISHSAIVNEQEGINVSVGPKGGSYFDKSQSIGGQIKNLFKSVEGELWENHSTDGNGWITNLNNVNKNILHTFSERIANGKNLFGGTLKYAGAFNSCVSYTSRALWAVGIPNIGIHPYLLQGSMIIRQLGLYASPYLIDR